jgi:hypothetical protein
MISVFYGIDGFNTSKLEHVKLNRLGFYIFPSGFYFWYQTHNQ